MFGPLCAEAAELVENFCAMHLGVNLRKAFLDGTKSHTTNCRDLHTKQHRDCHISDVMVHEFCKLFGSHGVPEYGCGVSSFLTYLQLMEESCTDDKATYFHRCIDISLGRQVGSRYFVTASNAGKILFLREAAIGFLQYTDKDRGNQLEQDVYEKLQSLE